MIVLYKTKKAGIIPAFFINMLFLFRKSYVNIKIELLAFIYMLHSGMRIPYAFYRKVYFTVYDWPPAFFCKGLAFVIHALIYSIFNVVVTARFYNIKCNRKNIRQL